MKTEHLFHQLSTINMVPSWIPVDAHQATFDFASLTKNTATSFGIQEQTWILSFGKGGR